MKKWILILIVMIMFGVCGSCGGTSAELIPDKRQTSTPIEAQNVSEAVSQPEIPVPAIDKADTEEAPPEVTYILNTNSRKFHKPFCRSVELMKPENVQKTSASREEVLEMCYTPCGNCKP